MQEITNTLPGNFSIPFLIPVSIIGITPNFQLNQYVYSFTSCTHLNPVFSYKNAKAITRLLCYLFMTITGLICILVMIIRVEISRQTWKRLKNVGIYVTIGGFFLSLIFIFVFVSVIQIKKEVVLSLCLDNVTFWIFFFICTFYTVRKIYFKKDPFPFIPTVVQEVNSIAELYNKNDDDIETQRLTIESKPQKSNLKKKIENQMFKEDIVMEEKKNKMENTKNSKDNQKQFVKKGKRKINKGEENNEQNQIPQQEYIEDKSLNGERKGKATEIKQKDEENKAKNKQRKAKKIEKDNENELQNDINKQEPGKEKLKKAIKPSKYDSNNAQKDEIKEETQIQNNEERPKSKKKIVFSPQVQKYEDKDKVFSFSKAYLNGKQNNLDTMTDSTGKMQSSLDRLNIKGDDNSLPDSVQDDAATCSSNQNQGRQKLKFSNKNRRMFDSPIFRPILDDGNGGDDSQPNSKSSLSKKNHDNLSNDSKDSINRDEHAFSNQSKSFGNIINQDQSDNLNPSSLSEFQRKDFELFSINKPKSLFYINNHDNEHDSQKGSQDTLRPRMRSLNKLAEDDELSEYQVRKYSQPRSENGENQTTKPHEVKKKSHFDKHAELIHNSSNGE